MTRSKNELAKIIKIAFFAIWIFSIVIAASQSVCAQEGTGKVIRREEKTLDLITKIDAFAEQDERLRYDAAIAHYNMGNIYYHKGEFEIAAREYYQAVTLMPDDPEAHFNLAFVSGEHLNDFITALKHYKMYLYLKPNAKDAHFVKEKILQTELVLRGRIDSPLDNR